MRVGLLALAGLLLSSCGGAAQSSDGGSDDPAPPAIAMVDMQPLEDGFAFANFPSSWYPEEFTEDDLVTLFGSGPSICVDGVGDPCVLTAEAAAFARMVNQSRAAGHCEGLAAVAQARFNEGVTPPTAELVDDVETIQTIRRESCHRGGRR